MQVPGEREDLPECSGELKNSAFQLLMVLSAQDAQSSSPAVLRCHRLHAHPQVLYCRLNIHPLLFIGLVISISLQPSNKQSAKSLTLQSTPAYLPFRPQILLVLMNSLLPLFANPIAIIYLYKAAGQYQICKVLWPMLLDESLLSWVTLHECS